MSSSDVKPFLHASTSFFLFFFSPSRMYTFRAEKKSGGLSQLELERILIGFSYPQNLLEMVIKSSSSKECE